MNNSLMLILLGLMFANNAVAQEDQSSTNQAAKEQAWVEEGQKAHHGKELKLKELIESKEYHDHDGWVQYSND